MVGLIKKDLYIIKNNFKIFYLIPTSFAILPGLQNTKFIMIILTIIFSFLFASQVLTTIGTDELTTWNKVTFSMPISIKKIVLSKYLVSFLLSVASGIFIFILGFLLNFLLHFTNEYSLILFWAVSGIWIGIVMNLITIPISYKFGAENSKYFFFGAIALPVLVTYILNYFNISTEHLYASVSSVNSYLFFSAVILIFIIVISVSILISNKVYYTVRS